MESFILIALFLLTFLNVGILFLLFRRKKEEGSEINNATKLWPILFENGLSPICICNGQNVTGDFSTNIMNLMITKTFPEELYSRGFKHFKQTNQ